MTAPSCRYGGYSIAPLTAECGAPAAVAIDYAAPGRWERTAYRCARHGRETLIHLEWERGVGHGLPADTVITRRVVRS